MACSTDPEVMYGYYGLGFPKSLAQTTSVQLAQAGANADQFKAPGASLNGCFYAVGSF